MKKHRAKRSTVGLFGSQDGGPREITLGAPSVCIVVNLASFNAETMTVEFNRPLYSCPIDLLALTSVHTYILPVRELLYH